MIQGATSNAGKSVVVAGLCRLFHSKGYRVAPFKPQNMALNSAVTIDGGEIGRSQAVQALACGIEPHTDMNPILLKPNSDKGAQVIIQGHSIGNMEAVEYHAYKKQAMVVALESYHRLATQYDLIIVEGAGSPAEINLRENDIANMGFATAVGCAVLIVADIDRGGVFAHLSGTLDCLSDDEQALVQGFLINRFRGDKTLLDSGIDWLSERTNVPTLGVLPYLTGLHIEAEDAVDYRSHHAAMGENNQRLKIVVPRIPRISNHTDFDVLRLHHQVDLVFVEEGQVVPVADLIILPGSKNTINDLNWLVENQWLAQIKKHLRYGGKLIGICGGYQMIGQTIHDPDGIEGKAGSQPGFQLMDFETTLAPIKQLTQVHGRLFGTHTPVTGYEIHIGVTQGEALNKPAIQIDDRFDGVISDDNQIMGTYLHGIFDHHQACDALLKWSGLDADAAVDYQVLRQREIDRVATMLDDEIDFDGLASNIGLTSSA